MTTPARAVSLLSATTSNLLAPDDGLFEGGTGSWSATNATLSMNFTFLFRNEFHTMQVSPTTTSPVTLTVDSVTLGSEYNNDYVTLCFHLYSASKTTINITLSDSFGNTVTRTVLANALSWTAVRGPDLVIPDSTGDITVGISVEISNHSGQSVMIASPALTSRYAFRNNLFLRMCMANLPAFLLETDYESSFPTFPLMRLLDIGTAYAGRAVGQAVTFRYRDIDSGYNVDDDTTKSRLVNPSVAAPEYLAWLAQVVGVKLSAVGGGSTPWGNLPTTWTLLDSQVDTDADTILEWSEIETYDITDANFVSSRRDLITTARTGFNAGTTNAIKSAVQVLLTGTKSVTVVPSTTDWTINVRTLTSETPNGVTGSPEALVVSEANTVRPAGFVIDHQCVTSL